ncbi:unnamed protein product, partial [marine sediment metagenome]
MEDNKRKAVLMVVVLFFGMCISPSIIGVDEDVPTLSDEYGHLRLCGENLDDDTHTITVWVSGHQFSYYVSPSQNYVTPYVEVCSGVDISFSVSWYCNEHDEEHGLLGFTYVGPGEFQTVECDVYLCDDPPTVVSIQPHAQYVEKGMEFTVGIYVEPSEPITAVGVDIYFDRMHSSII